MAIDWNLDRLKAMTTEKRLALYRNAKDSNDPQAKLIVALIIENDLPLDEDGGLPWDHPVMLEIEEICRLPESVSEAIQAAEKGLPPLAGMEHRIVAALGSKYGMHYTTHHAGRCIAEEMLSAGWEKSTQKPMPPGYIAKSATTFIRKGR